MNNDLRSIKECEKILVDIIDRYGITCRETTDCLSELMYNMEYEVYIKSGYKYCEECRNYVPKEEWSTKILSELESECICIKCEQTVLNDLEIEE